jgi:magnesium-transporting ATPase (P-type)
MIQELLSVEGKETPLQEKLNSIVSWVGNIGMTVAGLTFVVMTCKLVYKEYIVKNCSEALDPSTCVEMGFIPLLKEIVRYFIVAVTVVVVAIPEGLPLAVTISLAYSVAKMQKGNCLVRKIEASETMGGANQVVTDKTGTLTTNKMTVRGLYTMDTMFIEPQAFDGMKFQDLGNKDLMVEGVLYNCSAHTEVDKTTGKPIAVGNASEQGIIRFFIDNGIGANVESIFATKENSIICSIPFDSQRKKSLVAILKEDG